MQLREALDDHKRHRGHPRRFPGERRTTVGLFSGLGSRLVHVAPDGGLRDFGYPISGRSGIERSRFGLRVDGEVTWFDSDGAQRYVDGTALVVTDHRVDGVEATQYDLTLGETHITRIEVDGDVEEGAALVAYISLSPENQETRIGQLRLAEAVEVYHAEEHDFVAALEGFADLRGQIPARFDEVLGTDPIDLPRPAAGNRYEEDRLTGNLLGTVPLVDGAATLGTLLTDASETSRDHAVGRLRELLFDHDGRGALVEGARADASHLAVVDDDRPGAETATPDLRVLDLLSGQTGLRIAGPDFDPHYVHSGGYGYTWFRDDAEIARFLLRADDKLNLELTDWHARSARAYVSTQLPDGTWPHRVWPRDGGLAPGWANGHLEAGDDVEYQADQTASVTGFLAAYRERADRELREPIDDAVAAGVDGLERSLAEDGRPVACQNAWENAHGRFAHTTGTFLAALATVAASDHPAADRAGDMAARIHDGIDDLWVPEREAYALREHVSADESGVDEGLDDRLDSASLALVGAHREYARTEPLDEGRIDRLVAHVRSVFDGLERDPEGPTAGLVRYEGDPWRQRDQDGPKVWTVSTAWGANAAAQLAMLLADREDDRADEFARRARTHYNRVAPEGPLAGAAGYLPEQLFDDGTADSATPLGWPHAIRLATAARLAELGVEGTGSADN